MLIQKIDIKDMKQTVGYSNNCLKLQREGQDGDESQGFNCINT